VSFAVILLQSWLVKSIFGWGPSFNDFVSVTSNLMKFVLLLVSISISISISVSVKVFAFANFSAYKIAKNGILMTWALLHFILVVVVVTVVVMVVFPLRLSISGSGVV